MIVAFAEQNYDVMYECNEQLLQFCQVSALSQNFDRLSSANLTIYIEVSDVITALPTRRLGTLVSSHLKLNE